MLLIASINYMNLATARASRRILEVGLRKVLGASMSNITGMLTREFTILIIVSNLVAWPIARSCARYSARCSWYPTPEVTEG